jgi:hypothetical protein
MSMTFFVANFCYFVKFFPKKLENVFLQCKMFCFSSKNLSLLQNKIIEGKKKILINGNLLFLCKFVHWCNCFEIFVVNFNVL